MRRSLFVAVFFLMIMVLSACNGDKEGVASLQGKNPANLHTEWKFDKDPQSNTSNNLTITITDSNKKPVSEFDMNHGKQMHLVIVSKDLSKYQHVYPVYEGKGIFKASISFPQDGDFQLIAKFVPKGQSETVQAHGVSVTENKTLVPDKALVRIVGDNRVSLKLDSKVKAKQEATLTFSFQDIYTKKPVTDLQPYLGSAGHVFILNQDGNEYLDVYPTNGNVKGPNVVFRTTFPSAGVYKIWGEFQRNNRVITVPFVVEVSK